MVIIIEGEKKFKIINMCFFEFYWKCLRRCDCKVVCVKYCCEIEINKLFLDLFLN